MRSSTCSPKARHLASDKPRPRYASDSTYLRFISLSRGPRPHRTAARLGKWKITGSHAEVDSKCPNPRGRSLLRPQDSGANRNQLPTPNCPSVTRASASAVGKGRLSPSGLCPAAEIPAGPSSVARMENLRLRTCLRACHRRACQRLVCQRLVCHRLACHLLISTTVILGYSVAPKNPVPGFSNFYLPDSKPLRKNRPRKTYHLPVSLNQEASQCRPTTHH